MVATRTLEPRKSHHPSGRLAAGWRKADPVVSESAADGGIIHETVSSREVISEEPVVHGGVVFEAAATRDARSGAIVLSQP